VSHAKTIPNDPISLLFEASINQHYQKSFDNISQKNPDG
jgi:hypothetical protein